MVKGCRKIFFLLIYKCIVIYAYRKSADELEVPECQSNYDCVIGGVCVKDRGGKGRCFCSSSCPLNVPVQCNEQNVVSCMTMGDSYMTKYDMRYPLCYHKRCICPPTFDPVLIQPPIAGFNEYLSRKCDRRQLEAQVAISPSDLIYKGTLAHLFCCVNVDPRGFIPSDGVYFVQNSTRRRDPNITPYDNFSSDIDTLFTVPMCWLLVINNVQLSDAGSYICMVQPLNARYRTVNATLEFGVKVNNTLNAGVEYALIRKRMAKNAVFHNRNGSRIVVPRMIHNITIIPNITTSMVVWDPESELQIDLDLYRRSDRRTRVWHQVNASSPILMGNLTSATPYTLFIHVRDRGGGAEPVILTEQFQTLDSLPDSPLLEDIRVVNSDNSQQLCEVEWRPPRKSRSSINRYYVQIVGKVRFVSRDNPEVIDDDYPQGTDLLCSNYLLGEEKFIDPANFRSFYACKYGPLKPNRNYNVTVWAENKAGKSNPVIFNRQCIMDFAEPDNIDPPETLSRTNTSSFTLRYKKQPSESNGPIACYYLAVIPLPTNVSVDKLPAPELIAVDTFDKVVQNNFHHTASENNRFFAYIAESYLQLPEHTIIGDGDISGGVEPCNVLYLTRYKPTDLALMPELKYTGFLIVRVDRDPSLQSRNNLEVGRQINGRRPPRSLTELPLYLVNNLGDDQHNNRDEFTYRRRQNSIRRQLNSMDPAYGFSTYFKPVILEYADGHQQIVDVLLFCLLIALVTIATLTAVYFLHKKRYLKQFCPLKKSHDLLWNNNTSPPPPIKCVDVPTEYFIRHRDSDYHFTQEFEMLPRSKNLDHTISERKENARKNRYNDIKACDSTRVRLRKVLDANNSDYVNANFIKGYKGRKIFIATQGPLDCTVYDFWKMVWEQNCKVIIMVTNLRERGREQCVKYWPDEGDIMSFRSLEIRQTESMYHADYTVREFEMTSIDESQSRSSYTDVNCRGTNSTEPPPTNSPLLKQRSSSNFMNTSTCSVYSNASVHPHESQRPRSMYNQPSISVIPSKFDSEYANISTVIIRPQSKSSRRTESIETLKEKRRVVQYHFTSWNDYKAPECSTALLRLICRLRKLDAYNTTPIIIHCSAGVGRTGTYIAIDYIMDQCAEEGQADIFGCVSEMRQQRNLMVQSVEQYVFIYRALSEYVLFGDTDLTVPEFRVHATKLSHPFVERERHYSCGSSNSTSVIQSETSDKTNLQNTRNKERTSLKGLRAKIRQVRGIGSTSNNQMDLKAKLVQKRPLSLLEFEFNSKSIDWARRDENIGKNRFQDCCPYDANRVVLMPLLGYNNTYINASLVKGYFYPYILAQDPIDPDSAFDFWRMVNENTSYAIVMLSCEQDFDSNELYWPKDVTKRMVLGKNSELTITLAEEIVQPVFVQRKLHYRFKNEKGNTGRDVVQFAFRRWPRGSSVPDSRSTILDLIGRILERQSNIPDAGPIILHCRDGSAETGLFCCISMLLERLKSEQMIDVFRTVKSLQLQRLKIIPNIDQYAFCYDAVSEYLDINGST